MTRVVDRVPGAVSELDRRVFSPRARGSHPTRAPEPPRRNPADEAQRLAELHWDQGYEEILQLLARVRRILGSPARPGESA